MLAAAAGTSQPVVAALLGLGAAGLAGAVVAMAWSVHARQIRLAEMLVRRQFIVTGEPAVPGQALNGHADPETALVHVQEALEAVGARESQASQKAQGAQAGHPSGGGQGAQGAQTAQGAQGPKRPKGPKGHTQAKGAGQARLPGSRSW